MSYFEYRGAKLYYEIIGEGIPFLVIHGWAIDHRYTEHMMEPVFNENHGISSEENPETKFARVYIDLPGMGQSVPGFVKTGDDVVEILAAFMDEIFGGKQFVIGGNSFGAGVARAFGAKYPDKILALMLIVPSTGKLGRLPKEKYAVRDEAFLKTLSKADKACFVSMNACLTKEVWQRYETMALECVRSEKDNDFLHGKFRGRYSFDVDAAYRKRPFKKPVLCLCADHDTAVGFEDQKLWEVL